MLFSIVVAVYNREKEIARCVASVLSQSFQDYELVLVDDGSTDRSLAALHEFRAPNLKVIPRGTNGGVGAARNSGIAVAQGDWIVLLDSDDELVPGALAAMAERAKAAPDSVEGLWFRCRMDDGREIPAKLTSPQEWDYEGFLAFWNRTAREWRDMLYCNRRRSFAALPQPLGRMDDIKYLLDFAQRYRILAFPEVMRLYHQDAENQLVRITGRLHPRRDRAFILDRANEYRSLLCEHNRAVARAAPAVYAEYLESGATTAIMAGWRGEAIVHSLKLLRLSPLRPRHWILMAAALIGPRAVLLRRWMTRG